jgi:hypothetical protein
MTPKEKAEELFDKMYGITPIREDINLIIQDRNTTKECALICVDEILIVIENERVFESIDYWEEVKKEIELL